MTFLEWANAKLFGHARDAFTEAIVATDDATIKTRSLRKQLEPYRIEIDPFVSMTRKRLLAETLNNQQLNQMHRGPP